VCFWLVGTNLFTSKTDTSLVSRVRPRDDDDVNDERRKKTQKKNGARDLVSDRVMAARHTRCAAAGPKSVERAESDVRSARVDVWTTIIIDGVDWCVTRTNKSDIIRGR